MDTKIYFDKRKLTRDKVLQHMRTVLKKAFFNRDTLDVAHDLIGKVLVRKIRGKTIEGIIVETEAYDGPHDKASHAHRGKTPRNTIMFGPPAFWYVYLCYGMHYMLNIVTGEKEYPAAVLIRGVLLLDGTRLGGPGKVTRHFHIGKKEHTRPAHKDTGLWVEDKGIELPKRAIKRTPRIGINYAGEWKEKSYRFIAASDFF